MCSDAVKTNKILYHIDFIIPNIYYTRYRVKFMDNNS